MQAHIKNALITTAIVLATIFVARKLAPVKPIVDKALVG
jgi:hypothetical protein